MTASTRNRKKTIILIIFLAAVCIVICIQQYRAYDTVSMRFKTAIHKVHKKVATAEMLSREFGRIEKETALAVLNLKELDDQLPAILETARFIETVSQAAKKHNVVIRDVRTNPSAFDFWKQVDVMLLVSAEDVDVSAWLKMVTSGKRRVDYDAATGESKYKEVLLTIYAMPEPEMNTPREDFCRPIEHTVWLWPFTSRIEALKGELILICSEQARIPESIRALEQQRKNLARLTMKRHVYGGIERKHANIRKITSKFYPKEKGQPK